MRLIPLLVAATLSVPAAPARARECPAQSTVGQESKVESQETKDKQADKDPGAPTLSLPVSYKRIKQALEQPVEPLKGLRGLDETPTFRVEIRERLKIDELLQSLNFKSRPPVPSGLYGYEQQRQIFPPVDNPLVQPYAAFSQGELLTVLVENLVGRYLAGRAMQGITSAERARAEAAAREEVSH